VAEDSKGYSGKWRITAMWILLLLLGGGVQPWRGLADPWKDLGILRMDGSREAYDFRLEGMDGIPRSLKEFKGRVVLLAFWASFCPPCREEMPSLNALYNRWKDRGLMVLGISMDAGKEAAVRFMKRVGIDFPVLWDKHLEVGRRYRVYRIPMTFLIDGRGRLVGMAMGARDWDSPPAHKMIGAMLESLNR